MFDFFVRHKASKANVVFNVLSRFSGNSVAIAKDGSGVLKALYEQALKIRNFSFKKKKSFSEKLFIIYHITFVEMFDDFKSRLFLKYIKNKQ